MENPTRPLEKEYVIYDRNEQYLFGGNSIQCAKYLGIKEKSFRTQVSRCRKNMKRRYYLVVCLSDEEEEKQ